VHMDQVGLEIRRELRHQSAPSQPLSTSSGVGQRVNHDAPNAVRCFTPCSRDQMDVISGIGQRNTLAVKYAAVVDGMTGTNVTYSHGSNR